MCVGSLKHALCSQTGQHSVHAAGHRPWARRRRRRGRTKTRTLPGQRTSKVGMRNQSCVVALHAYNGIAISQAQLCASLYCVPQPPNIVCGSIHDHLTTKTAVPTGQQPLACSSISTTERLWAPQSSMPLMASTRSPCRVFVFQDQTARSDMHIATHCRGGGSGRGGGAKENGARRRHWRGHRRGRGSAGLCSHRLP